MGGLQRRPGQLEKKVREICRRRNLAVTTENIYFSWVKRFIRFHDVRHPEDMGAAEMRDFLSYLATQRHVAASTQNQALNALVFLYRDVLGRKHENFGRFIRAREPNRLPVVLSKEQARIVLGQLSGQTGLVARLLYGSGLRIKEGVSLRVKDIDFELDMIHIQAASDWLWQYVFPSLKRTTNSVTGEKTRHHTSPSTIQKRLKRPHIELVFRNGFPVTPFGTVSPHTCWNPDMTSVLFRNCWVTRI